MAFAHTRTASTSASPEHVWALWSDPSTWPLWDPAVERVVLDGPFRLGTTGTMSLPGGVRAPFTLVEVSPDARCCDELALGEQVAHQAPQALRSLAEMAEAHGVRAGRRVSG